MDGGCMLVCHNHHAATQLECETFSLPPAVTLPALPPSSLFPSSYCCALLLLAALQTNYRPALPSHPHPLDHLKQTPIQAPDAECLERFLGRLPLVMNVVIMSPHGYFGQTNVLGLPDTGGQVGVCVRGAGWKCCVTCTCVGVCCWREPGHMLTTAG